MTSKGAIKGPGGTGGGTTPPSDNTVPKGFSIDAGTLPKALDSDGYARLKVKFGGQRATVELSGAGQLSMTQAGKTHLLTQTESAALALSLDRLQDTIALTGPAAHIHAAAVAHSLGKAPEAQRLWVPHARRVRSKEPVRAQERVPDDDAQELDRSRARSGDPKEQRPANLETQTRPPREGKSYGSAQLDAALQQTADDPSVANVQAFDQRVQDEVSRLMERGTSEATATGQVGAMVREAALDLQGTPGGAQLRLLAEDLAVQIARSAQGKSRSALVLPEGAIRDAFREQFDKDAAARPSQRSSAVPTGAERVRLVAESLERVKAERLDALRPRTKVKDLVIDSLQLEENGTVTLTGSDGNRKTELKFSDNLPPQVMTPRGPRPLSADETQHVAEALQHWAESGNTVAAEAAQETLAGWQTHAAGAPQGLPAALAVSQLEPDRLSGTVGDVPVGVFEDPEAGLLVHHGNDSTVRQMTSREALDFLFSLENVKGPVADAWRQKLNQQLAHGPPRGSAARARAPVIAPYQNPLWSRYDPYVSGVNPLMTSTVAMGDLFGLYANPLTVPMAPRPSIGTLAAGAAGAALSTAMMSQLMWCGGWGGLGYGYGFGGGLLNAALVVDGLSTCTYGMGWYGYGGFDPAAMLGGGVGAAVGAAIGAKRGHPILGAIGGGVAGMVLGELLSPFSGGWL
jgi:hypothetical protein